MKENVATDIPGTNKAASDDARFRQAMDYLREAEEEVQSDWNSGLM